MKGRNNRQLAVIRKEIIKTQVFGIPAALLLGLGLYGLFAANGDAFHPLLNNQNVVYGMLVAGAILEVLQIYRLIPLLKEQVRLLDDRNPYRLSHVSDLVIARDSTVYRFRPGRPVYRSDGCEAVAAGAGPAGHQPVL